MAEKVNGIGGFFFRSQDPETLSAWYRDNLGVSPIPEDYGGTPWFTEAGPTALAPFPQSTDYFGSFDKVWMINFRVNDLDAIVAQLRRSGVSVEVDTKDYPNGRFARLHDPEGNPVELWEPRS